MRASPRAGEHAEDWRDLWKLVRKVSETHGPGGRWSDPLKREAFEFVRTSLVYHRNALARLRLSCDLGRGAGAVHSTDFSG
jgi:hypothetical protein